jgi:N-acetylglutamate synthase-like GNAT family acetyltransferase
MNQDLQYRLRPARAEDGRIIRSLVRKEHLNPMGIHWSRFTVAVDQNDAVIGCAQMKIHFDSSRELASLVVEDRWRGQGIARALITSLLNEHPGVIYLTCAARLEPLYQHLGFCTLSPDEMPPYFRRIYRLFNGLLTLFTRSGGFKVMRHAH